MNCYKPKYQSHIQKIKDFTLIYKPWALSPHQLDFEVMLSQSHIIGTKAAHRPSYTATRRRNRRRKSAKGLTRKGWEVDEEALGAITKIHEKRRDESRKNREMDWVKLSSVTSLTVVKTVQCHIFNDGIPPRMSVFEARWIVTNQNDQPHIQKIKDSTPIYKVWVFLPYQLAFEVRLS